MFTSDIVCAWGGGIVSVVIAHKEVRVRLMMQEKDSEIVKVHFGIVTSHFILSAILRIS